MRELVIVAAVLLISSVCAIDLIIEYPKNGTTYENRRGIPVLIHTKKGEGEDTSNMQIELVANGTVVMSETFKEIKTSINPEADWWELEARVVQEGKTLLSKTLNIAVGELFDKPAVGNSHLWMMTPRDKTTMTLDTTVPLKASFRIATNGPVWPADSTTLFVTVTKVQSQSDGEHEKLEEMALASQTYPLPILTSSYRAMHFLLDRPMEEPGEYTVQADVVRNSDEEVLASATSTITLLAPRTETRKTPIEGISHVYICHWAPLVERHAAMMKTLARLGLDDSHVTWITDFDRRTTTPEEIEAVYTYDEELQYDRLRVFYPRENQYLPPPPRRLSPGEILVTMCHLKVYTLMQQHNDLNALIMEDDTCFYSNFTTVWPKYWEQVPKDYNIFFIGSGVNQHMAEDVQEPGKLVYLKPAPSSRTAGSYVITLTTAEAFLQTMIPFALVSDGELDYQLWLHSHKVYWAEPNIAYEGTREGNHFESVVQEGRSSSQHAAVVFDHIATRGWYILENVTTTNELHALRAATYASLAQKDVPYNVTDRQVTVPDMIGIGTLEFKDALAALLRSKLMYVAANAALERNVRGGSVQICSNVMFVANYNTGGGRAAIMGRSVPLDTDGRVVRAYLFFEDSDYYFALKPGAHIKPTPKIDRNDLVSSLIMPNEMLLIDERMWLFHGQPNWAPNTLGHLEIVMTVDAEETYCRQMEVTPDSIDWMRETLAGSGMEAGPAEVLGEEW